MMGITRESFGTTANGARVDLYTLSNGNLTARIASYGGTLVSLEARDREGKYADIVLGFDTLEPYLGDHPYFGSLIGRYANRIRGGRFELQGTTYQLPRNDGSNHLHGGPHGFHTANWNADASESSGGPQLRLSYRSASGEQGYPGNLDVEVLYTLTDRDELRLDYSAMTDAPTIINLTNHAYFNLAGAGTILGHELHLRASRFLPVGETLIPLGELREVRNTAFDFTSAAPIGTRLQQGDEQLVIARGYDHTWVLDPTTEECALAGELHHPQSGRTMRVHTTQPGVQIYSGNFLDGTVRGKAGAVYVKHAGLCVETQHFPDSPNQPAFPSTLLKAGERYRERTIYGFSAS